ncbi:unnamed protein product [Adineta ricciae]|uniref:Fibronectin type-II domain-containing protein n=1 Tax=Adineta ricciae TaxID=249248 RepID=A0A814KCQ1_ADIRI|nr:unnamed protein product [Adineta ricciae]
MVRQFIVSVSIVLICFSFYAERVLAANYASVYPFDTSNCQFPFNYNGKTYNNCTTDGDNGNTLWCSLTTDYIGQFTYCYDFFKPSLECSSSFQVNGKTFTGCSLLSKSAAYKQCKTNNTDFPTIYCPDAKKPTTKTIKGRRTNCEQKFKSISDVHTKCFQPSPFAVKVPITDDEKQALLDMHNQYRAAVPSEHMFKLSWNDKLADMAQARGDLCVFDHDLAGNRIIPDYGWKNGQNLVWSTEIRLPLDSLIDSMLGSEKERFVYGVGCTSPGSCLHYTQAMLSNITHMGCAHTHCVYTTHIDRFLTCNYLQSQYASKYMTPYVNSSLSATKCPQTAVDGLCDCGDKSCNYGIGEYLDPNTCTCKVDKSKRSLNKRDANDDDVLIAAPRGGAGNLLSKRSINYLRKPKPKS